MNKLAGKELQSLPSQINAGYREGAAATALLSASLHAFIFAQSQFRSNEQREQRGASSGATGLLQQWCGSRAHMAAPVPGQLRGFKELPLPGDRAAEWAQPLPKRPMLGFPETKTLIQLSVHLF